MTSMENTPVKAAGIILFRNTEAGREYLLLHHIPEHGNHWSFPKGRVDPGEISLEQTARREVAEETGITEFLLIPGFAVISEYKTADDRDKIVTFFLASTQTGEVILSHEHQAYAWLPYGKARERLTFPVTKEILDKAEKFLHN